MFRVAARLVSSADVEDVVQESWRRAFARLGAFHRRSTLSTWLCGIVINVVRESVRDAGWLDVPLEDKLIGDTSPSNESMDIERAVSALPPAARVAFLLHDVEGFTHDEIAEQTGWHPGTSKTLVSRARNRLRALLKDGYGESRRKHGRA
jgi:RNA polymerase sigma-70 factor (ECF subfamily)